MTTLLVDVGNTRIKWAQLVTDELDGVQALHHGGDPAVAAEGLRRELVRGPSQIVVANVAGSRIATALTEIALAEAGVLPQFLVSQAEACGVRNAYLQPERLGVDRWAAMIAGRARAEATRPGAASCIISAGTAVTVDAIRGDGVHLGGIIVAGPGLQAAALAARTSAIDSVSIEVSHPGGALNTLGHSTEEAVAFGAWHAAAGAVARVLDSVERSLGARPMVYVCGGYASRLNEWIDRPRLEIRNDLVLEGMALISRRQG